MRRAAMGVLVVLLLLVSAGCGTDTVESMKGAEMKSAESPGADADAGPVWPEHLAEIVEEARDEFGVPTVTVPGRKTLPAETIVVDVRAPEEMAVSTIPGARQLGTASERKAFLAEKHKRPVLVYCTAGWRSAEFTADLRKAGIEAYNLEGGICAWALYGESVVDAEGEATRRIHGYNEDWADCVPEGFEAVW